VHPEDPPGFADVVGDVVCLVEDVTVVLADGTGVVVFAVFTGVVTGFEAESQTIAPLTHFVPDDTAPILTNAELTQTDQLFPSAEH
jgi:hypothetical protein